MWENKRVLKKHKKQRSKLTTIVYLCISAIVGIFGYSLYLLFTLFSQPIITRPIPTRTTVLGERVVYTAVQTEIEELVKEKQISYKTIEKIDNVSYRMQLLTNAEVFFTTDRNLTEQITSLQVILTRTTMEGRHFTRLDLRFDKPVIVWKNDSL